MSGLAGILVLALLFVLFCALPPRKGGAGCAGCGAMEDGNRDSCSGCPHTTERSNQTEVRAPR